MERADVGLEVNMARCVPFRRELGSICAQLDQVPRRENPIRRTDPHILPQAVSVAADMAGDIGDQADWSFGEFEAG